MPDVIARLRSRPQCCGRLRRRTSDEDGFVLLETMVAITIITVIMTALTTLFVTVMGSTNHERAAQAGAQVAGSALDKARGLGAGGAVKGLGSTANPAWFAAAQANVKPWLAAISPAYDTTADPSAGASASLPTAGVQQTVNGKAFTVNSYVGWCNRQADGTCTAATGTVQYVRVVVAVTWNDHSCGTSGCKFVTATLLSGATDPVFLFNQAPPSQPHLATIANQTSEVGDVVNGPTASTKTGVPPFVFTATGLPPGLAMNQAGLVTGSPTTQTGSPFSVTVTVTDGFQNTATIAFTWTVYPAIKVTTPSNQVNDAGRSISGLQLAASGGSGSLTFADPSSTLPTGLSISSSGKITGTPTAAGTYPVTIAVTDTIAGSKQLITFQWVVNPAPFVTTPGDQVNLVGDSVSVPVTAQGGTGSLTYSATGLPSGLSINSTSGIISGTPTKLGTNTVTVTATDAIAASASISFNWPINPALSITTPSNQAGEVGAAVTLQVAAVGGIPPYSSWSATGLPTGLSINNSGQITGTPTATGSFTVAVSAKDARGTAKSSSSFNWVISPALKINVPDQSTAYTTTVSLNLNALTSGGGGSYRYSASGLPTGLTCSTAGVISGTTNTTAVQKSVVVTVTDGVGGTATDTFNWWVSSLSLPAIADQTTAPGGAASLTISAATGGATTKTYTTSALPSWLSFNASTRKFTGTAPAGLSMVSITVTVTDSTGAFDSDTFNWFVTDLSLNFPTTYSTGKNTNVSLDLRSMTSGGSGNYTTYTVSALPSGLSFDGGHTISGRTSGSSSTKSVTVTVTDSLGATTSDTFTWKVS